MWPASTQLVIMKLAHNVILRHIASVRAADSVDELFYRNLLG